uniref:Pept_C1 domain-containing protein n=1 Tax=Caenorhabditis tropicalis TaxID=1561998 RepID=A0A1I7UNN3_9PELO
MSPIDQAKARSVFQFNVENIIRLNQKYSNSSLRFGINYYSDFSDLEFKEKISNLHVDSISEIEENEKENEINEESPISFDWRNRNETIGEVKNQGYCGCSWGFTVSSVIQSAYSIKNSKFFIPSEQQLCDCAQNGNSGCSGGSVEKGFEYIKQNGIVLESNYQKHDENQQQMYCAPQKENMQISNYRFIQPATSSQIQKILLNSGPIAVGFKVSNSFRHYQSGVFSLNDCDNSDNFIGWHSVLIVGYGSENGEDYWIAMNSWSPSFGENGFFRISKNVDLCQIESKMPTYVEL